MQENIISVFARGNQEMFHSAFLAWLLRSTAPHGFGDGFLRALLSHLPTDLQMPPFDRYIVKTEVRDGPCRFDILVQPTEASSPVKGLVFENKVKSFGHHLQLDSYKSRGYEVAVLALLPETLDAETRARYPVIEYRMIHDILRRQALAQSDHYHSMVTQYADFLDGTVGIFDAIRALGNGELDTLAFIDRVKHAADETEFSDNDIRTFDYFYYHAFANYLSQHEPDLWFGGLSYEEAKGQEKTMGWNYEKNMQGPPFMETIFFNPITPSEHWKPVEESLTALYGSNPFQVAPRIELWLDPVWIAREQNPSLEVGRIMLGTWSKEFRDHIRSREPYVSRLRPIGSRHFHREMLPLRDLSFSSLAGRLRAMLSLMFEPATARRQSAT
jgi:hypothetical protein